MTGETNQGMGEVMDIAAGADTNALELPESLFAEDEAMPETTAEAGADAEAVKEEGQEEQSGSTAEDGTPSFAGGESSATGSAAAQTLKIKYNGKEEDISLDEAVALAQKGRDYDHVREERDTLRSLRTALEAQAKRSGQSVEQYIEMLDANHREAERKNVMLEVENEFPDAPETLIRELTELRMDKKQRDDAAATAERSRAESEVRIKPWRDFMAAFPDVDVNSLPANVVSEIQGGKSPVEAYQAHLIAELQRENQIAEQRGKNKALAVGSAQGDAAEKVKDEFLDGFWG